MLGEKFKKAGNLLRKKFLHGGKGLPCLPTFMATP